MMQALVTGAGQRLGQAMALYLARRGYDVALHYSASQQGAMETAARITAMGRRAICVQADLLVEDEMQSLVPRAVAGLGGPLTVLVNNASVFEYDTITNATRRSWDRHMESNLRAPFVLSQAFAAQVPAFGHDEAGEAVSAGLIVNMIDQRVLKPTPEFMTYSLAKMALWSLTRTMAQALAPRIRVNAIGPGSTLKAPRQSEAHFNAQRMGSILQRGANIGDITAALGYFLDAQAVTGQILAVDGGQHLGWKTPDIIGVEKG